MTTCIIPARAGSRRIPGKNTNEFLGIPMLKRAITVATDSCLFKRLVVSTNDHEAAEIAQSMAAHVSWRPEQLSRDDVGTQRVMAYDCQHESGTVCCLYPCVPLVVREDILRAYRQLMNNNHSYVVSVAADPLRDIGNFYFGHAALFRSEAPLYTSATGLYVMPPERAVDINTPEDWALAETLYEETFG